MRPILLVEDGVSYFDTLRWTLRRAGYSVDCVSGAQEALDYLRLADPLGLIVLHCQRPDLDLLGRLRQTGAPVVVVTPAVTALPGVAALLGMPVDESELLTMVLAQHAPGG